MTADKPLTRDDLERLADRGITPEGAATQLERLRRPPRPTPLLRPCRPGDGLHRLKAEDHPRLEALWLEAAARGRFSKFVPASGAATRMLAAVRSHLAETPPPARDELERRAEGGDPRSIEVRRILDHLHRFAFADRLAAALGRRHGVDRPLDTLSDPERLKGLVAPWGLDLARLPKALVEFHRTDTGPRTALEEQFVEGLEHLAPAGAICRLHFTVSPEWRDRVTERFRALPGSSQARGRRLELKLSIQSPATDTLATDENGAPARDEAGRLLLRPSGHGALLGNLEATGGDLVYVKNIDNIAHPKLHALTARWKRLLGGLLVDLAARAGELAERLAEDPGAGREAVDFLTESFALEPPTADSGERARWAAGRLERPIRVAGMVENAGEPGGGPFWVPDDDGLATGQIVEGAQVGDEAAQRRIWSSSTHFNPVDLVCALRDRHGHPYPLARWVDSQAYLLGRKSHGAGRVLRTLERPGLWNGAMAGWNTAFVEVPLETFNPVKTLADLLRPAHLDG